MELLQQIQKKELGALMELRRISERHSIRYFLAQGTLIGAAREGGFIPWDDDIDVLVPDGDLRRLMTVFSKEADPAYRLTDYRVERHYPLSWSKIRIAGTKSCPTRYQAIPIDWGICIDLFPIYGVSNWKLIREGEVLFFKFARKLLLCEMTQYDGHRSLLTRVLEKVPISIRRFVMDVSTSLFALHGEDTRWVYITCRGGRLFRRDIIFGQPKTLCFEGLEYSVPSDYDQFLRLQFGDYMTPPPVEERGGHDLRMGDIQWIV